MPLLTQAPLPYAPHRCLATNRDDGEIIDMGVDVNINEPFPRLYLQRGVVEEAAREVCGMVSGAEVDALRLQVEGFAEKVAELQVDLDAAKAFEERFGENLEAGATVGVQAEVATPSGPVRREVKPLPGDAFEMAQEAARELDEIGEEEDA